MERRALALAGASSAITASAAVALGALFGVFDSPAHVGPPPVVVETETRHTYGPGKPPADPPDARQDAVLAMNALRAMATSATPFARETADATGSADGVHAVAGSSDSAGSTSQRSGSDTSTGEVAMTTSPDAPAPDSGSGSDSDSEQRSPTTTDEPSPEPEPSQEPAESPDTSEDDDQPDSRDESPTTDNGGSR